MSNRRQLGYSPKIHADDRWIRWDSKENDRWNETAGRTSLSRWSYRSGR